MSKKVPFEIGEFAPDSPEFNNNNLEELRNGIPMYDGYRSIRESEIQSTVEKASNYVTGAHAHLITNDTNQQHIKASGAQTGTGSWENEAYVNVGMPASINDTLPDDTTFVQWGEYTGTNPTSGTFGARLSTATDPGGSADNDYHLDIRYRGFVDKAGDSATLNANIQGITDGVITATTQWIATGDDEFWDGNWKTKRLTLTDADADSITTFSDLDVLIDASLVSTGQDDFVSYPQADILNEDDWVTESDSAEDIYASIDSVTSFGDTPDDNAYIVTPPEITWDTTTSYTAKVKGARIPIEGDADVQLKMRVKTDDSSNVTFDAIVGDADETLAQTIAADDTWETLTETLQATTVQKWAINASGDTAWEDFPVKLEVSGISDSAAQTNNPTGVGATNEWTTSAGGGAASASDVDTLGGSYAIATGASAVTTIFTGAAMTEPSDHTKTKVTIKFKYTGGGGAPSVKWKLYYNGTSENVSKQYQCTVPYQTRTFTLPEATSQALDWGSAWRLDLIKTSGSSHTVYVDYLEISAPGGVTRFYVSDVWMEVPAAQGVQVSWVDFVLPGTATDIRGDGLRLYAGSKEKLWAVNNEGWVDVSRTSADYGQGSDEPQAWDFCSWGGNVIATNYEDEVQVLDLEAGNSEFDDLITGTTAADYEVRAKFCDVVGNHLVLANIGAVEDFGVPTAYTDAYSYTVWWSKINDPTSFAIGDYANLSDIQHLRSTPGEITGFAGGEFGTIFKRDSIYRMSWVGGNLVFRFDVLAKGVGTTHPSSIVSMNGDIFFYGHNDFYVMPQGGQPVPLAQGRIKAMLLESEWGERAINRDDYTLQVDNDLRVVGTYDQFTGLIFWAIDNYSTNSDYTKKSDIVVYNPKDGRFGYIRDARYYSDADVGISYIVSSPNIQQDTISLLNNLHIFTYDTGPSTNVMNMEKFVGDSYLEMEFTTNTVSADQIISPPGELMRMKAVRPFYGRIASRDYESDSEGSELDVPYTVTVYSSYDPMMIDDVASATATKDDENDNAWSALSKILVGEFWKLKMNVPSWEPVVDTATYGAIKALRGIQLDVDEESKH